MMRARRLGQLATSVCLAIFVLGTSPSSAHADVAVVMHADSIEGDLTVRHLRLLYSGYTRRWSDGHSVELVLPASESPAMGLLIERVFKLEDEDDVHRFYLHAIFRERIAIRPQQLNDREAIALVERTPGAIALVDAASIPAGAQLRTVLVQAPTK